MYCKCTLSPKPNEFFKKNWTSMPLRQMPPDSEYLSEEGKIDELVVAGKKEDIKWDIRTNFNLTKSNKNAVQKCIQNKYKIFITNNNKTKIYINYTVPRQDGFQ